MNRKGQEAISQIFIYVISGIIVVMIIIYGYSAVKSFQKKSEEIADIKFQKDLQEAFERLYTDLGSLTIFDNQHRMDVSPRYSKICFAETETPSIPEIDEKYPYIKRSVCGNNIQCKTFYQVLIGSNCNGCSKDNVFFVTSDMEKSFYIRNMKVADKENKHFFCADVKSGHINIKLESLGKYVQVSPLS